MPNYTVVLTKLAKKQLDKLPDIIALPMLEKIQNLSIDPRPNGYIKLKGSDVCRIRLGNYRVIYRILDEILIIDVINLGHRKDIYN